MAEPLALITRPAPGGAATRRALRRRGFRAVVSATQRIVFVAAPPPLPPRKMGLVALTSANAARAAAKLGLAARLAHVPCATVGEATARAAARAGFGPVALVRPDARALLKALRARAETQAVLHLTGARPRVNLVAELTARGREAYALTLYRAEDARALTPAAREAARAGSVDAALFYSPAATRAFVRLARALPPDAWRKTRAVAISQACARPLAALPWRAVIIARAPDGAGVLAALDEAFS